MTPLEFWVTLAAFCGVMFMVLLALIGGYFFGFNRGYDDCMAWLSDAFGQVLTPPQALMVFLKMEQLAGKAGRHEEV